MTVDLEKKACLKTGTDPVPEKLFIRWKEFRKSINLDVIHHKKTHRIVLLLHATLCKPQN